MKKVAFGFALTLFGALTYPAASQAQMQDLAGKVVRIVVPLAPGGSADLTARLIPNHLQKPLNANVIVENRPGGGGQIGVEQVIQAQPNGQTLLISPNGYVTVMGGFRADFPDPRKALAPISMLVTVPVGIAVSSASPLKSISEFIALGKSKSQDLSYSVPAIGTHMHLVGELFKMETGVVMQAVPYKGTGPAAAALVAGEVQATVSDMSSLLPQARAAKVRILGMTDPKRTSVVPDIPTVAEQGISGFGLSAWIGMFAPAGTPNQLVQSLNAEVAKILQIPEVRNALVTAGLDPAANSTSEMADVMDRDIKKWAVVVKQAAIKFQ